MISVTSSARSSAAKVRSLTWKPGARRLHPAKSRCPGCPGVKWTFSCPVAPKHASSWGERRGRSSGASVHCDTAVSRSLPVVAPCARLRSPVAHAAGLRARAVIGGDGTGAGLTSQRAPPPVPTAVPAAGERREAGGVLARGGLQRLTAKVELSC